MHVLRLSSGVVLLAAMGTLASKPARAAQIPLTVATGEDSAGAHGDVLQSIEFTGLRRVQPASLKFYIHSAVGRDLDKLQLERDLRALDHLGWFDSVRVEILPAKGGPAAGRLATEGLSNRADDKEIRLVFEFEERPFLSEVRFSGSHALSRERITSILAEKQIALKTAAPLNRAELWRAARAIETELANLGHPRARVNFHSEETPGKAARVVLTIDDGPRVGVSSVAFEGNQGFAAERLRHQMRRVAPGAFLAGLRSKDVYTPARLSEDLNRLREFYQNHGYAEMRFGTPREEVRTERVLRWWPWPRHQTRLRFHISVPIQEGALYQWGDVTVENETRDKSADKKPPAVAALSSLREGEAYSAEMLEAARVALQRAESAGSGRESSRVMEVDDTPQFDSQAGTVDVHFRVREIEPFVVRRLEFRGQRRFSERYYRRHILLEEGKAFDEAKLSHGIAQLARTGFIRPVRKQDIHVRLDELHHTADVAIRIEEAGQQKISFVGGKSNLGNTLGLVYNVFDVFGREELLTAHLEGGPESLQVLLGIAKEGVLGNRASLAFTLFQDVIRPNLVGNPNGTGLFHSARRGLGLAWGRPVGANNSFAVTYELSHSTTQYSLALPSAITGQPSNQVRSSNATRSVGLNWARDTGRERFDEAASVSGGWLGGNEDVLRSTTTYSRLDHDPFGKGRNTWGFRTYFAGVSSYHGDLPFQDRLFSGDQAVRGFRTGELAPYAITESTDASGKNVFHAQSPGANVTGALNTEYRMPLFADTQMAGFFDAGSARVLPNWLGPDRPNLLRGTNGVLRASTGVELQWTVPAVHQPVRLHYAYNPLRLTHPFVLPDGSLFRPRDRKTALGWAFGSLF